MSRSPRDESSDGSPDRPLLTPFDLGPYRLPSRVVMAPMTRNRAGEGNVPTEMNALYYRQRASAALILTEATPVEPRGHGYPGIPGLHTDEQEEGWARVTDAVHREGGRIFSQLWHTGRISHPLTLGNERPVAPSAVKPAGEAMTPEGPKPFVTPRPLEVEEVEEIVALFRGAAERAYRANFDGVELHAANGYLVDQFLRDGTNRRTDRYGGSVEDRARFLVEVTEALVEVWGPERVGVRLSPLNDLNDMEDSDPPSTFGYAARRLGELGIAYLHVVEPGSPKPPVEDEGETGRTFRAIRDAFPGPLVANGGYDRESGNAVVEAGYAQLVSYAKLFLANPDLPRRFAEGLPLNEPDPDTFYGGDEEGYVDYPTWEELQQEEAEVAAGG